VGRLLKEHAADINFQKQQKKKTQFKKGKGRTDKKEWCFIVPKGGGWGSKR